MAEIVWTSPAFQTLETFPEPIAFGIIRQTDHLRAFPNMGSPLSSRFDSLNRYRQLIFRRRFRVIYEYDEFDDCIYLLIVQDCRQKLPSARELHRRPDPDEEMPLE